MADIKACVHPSMRTLAWLDVIKSGEGINGRAYPCRVFCEDSRHGPGFSVRAGRGARATGGAVIDSTVLQARQGPCLLRLAGGQGAMKYFNGDAFIGTWKRRKPTGAMCIRSPAGCSASRERSRRPVTLFCSFLYEVGCPFLASSVYMVSFLLHTSREEPGRKLLYVLGGPAATRSFGRQRVFKNLLTF